MMHIQEPFSVTVPIRTDGGKTEHWPAEVIGVAMDGDRDVQLVVIVKHNGRAHAQLIEVADLEAR